MAMQVWGGLNSMYWRRLPHLYQFQKQIPSNLRLYIYLAALLTRLRPFRSRSRNYRTALSSRLSYSSVSCPLRHDVEADKNRHCISSYDNRPKEQIRGEPLQNPSRMLSVLTVANPWSGNRRVAVASRNRPCQHATSREHRARDSGRPATPAAPGCSYGNARTTESNSFRGLPRPRGPGHDR